LQYKEDGLMADAFTTGDEHHEPEDDEQAQLDDTSTEVADTEEDVDGDVLAKKLAGYISTYVKLKAEHLTAIVLWVLHTHSFGAADATSYLFLTSPQKQSGKTRLQEALEFLVRNPMRTSGISVAALFRSIEAQQPTLLFDEVDVIWGSKANGSEDLRGVLDSGNRKGGGIIRLVPDGEDWVPKKFSTWSPKCIAGIDKGHFPDTITDRSVMCRLDRKKPEDKVAAFRVRDAEETATPLREEAERWAEQNIDALAAARIEPVEGISDRAHEGFEPLLAIANQLGGDWPEEALNALTSLYRSELAMQDTLEVILLRALKTVMGDGECFGSKELATRLNSSKVDDDDAPWVEWKEQMTAHQLAKILKPFGIETASVRPDKGGDKIVKGYKRIWFLEIWERYLASDDAEGVVSL
jgi:hypothetical protein